MEITSTQAPPTQARTELKLGRKVFRVAIYPSTETMGANGNNGAGGITTATNSKTLKAPKTLDDCLMGFLKQRISAYLSNPSDPAGIWLSNHKVNHKANIEVTPKINHEGNSRSDIANDSHSNEAEQHQPQGKPKSRSPPHLSALHDILGLINKQGTYDDSHAILIHLAGVLPPPRPLAKTEKHSP